MNLKLDNIENEIERTTWWWRMRLKYNLGILISGLISFLIYVIIVEVVVKPKHPNADLTLISVFIHGLFFLVCVFIANIFYFLGSLSELVFKPKNIIEFRKILFNVGFWFSVILPLLIPVVLLIQNL